MCIWATANISQSKHLLYGVSERHKKKVYIGFLLMHRSRLKPRLVSYPLCAPMTSKNSVGKVHIQ